VIARSRLLDLGLAADDVGAAEARAKERMARASEAALAAGYPDPDARRATEFAP